MKPAKKLKLSGGQERRDIFKGGFKITPLPGDFDVHTGHFTMLHTDDKVSCFFLNVYFLVKAKKIVRSKHVKI